MRKALTLTALASAALIALAANYGPYRCSNGCDARNPADGATRAFISGDVNATLTADAAARGQVHQWRPGDTLMICDGAWCSKLDYHPLTGLFIWNAVKFPAFPDTGNRASDIGFTGWSALELELLKRMAAACLNGTFSRDSNFGGSSSYWEGPDMTVVTFGTATLGFPSIDDYCGF